MEGGQLCGEEWTRGRLNVLGYARYGGMGTVSGAEGVKDEHVGQIRQRLRQHRVVGGLAGLEASILEQNHVTWLTAGHRRFGVRSNNVGGRPHRKATQFGKHRRHRRHAQRLIDPPVWTPEMTAHDDDRARLPQRDDGRKSCSNTEVVRHNSTGQRHIEVCAKQHATTCDIEAVQRQERGHFTPCPTTCRGRPPGTPLPTARTPWRSSEGREC